MLRAVVFAVFLAGLVSQSQEHAIGNGTCDLRFQEYIKAAIAVKRECKSVTFHDCCQVRACTLRYADCCQFINIATFILV